MKTNIKAYRHLAFSWTTGPLAIFRQAVKQLVVYLLSLSSLAIPAAQGATHTVEIGDFFFNPSTLNINVGDSVRWTVSAGTHDTTSGNPPTGATWESELMFAGESFTFPFDTAGSFPYACGFHFGGPFTMLGLVTVASGPVMIPPTVNILPNGTTLNAPAELALTADASDSDGTVAAVEFYLGANLITTDDAAPYSAACGGLPAGNYVLTAVATDNDGLSSTSAPVNVVVRHVVSYQFTSFNPNALTVAQGDSVLFTNRDGGQFSSHSVTGTGAEAYCGSTLRMFCNVTFDSLGVFPYRCVPHSFAAGGGRFSGMTGGVAVVSTILRPPLVTIARPLANETFAAGASFTIETGNVIDPDGSVTNVEFFASAAGEPVSIGNDPTAPFAVTVATGLASGTYMLTARATDNTGIASTSAPVAITIEGAEIRLTAPSVGQGSLFQFNYNSTPGMIYVIEGSTTLNSVLPMAPLATNTATGSISTFTDPEQRLYRMYRVRFGP